MFWTGHTRPEEQLTKHLQKTFASLLQNRVKEKRKKWQELGDNVSSHMVNLILKASILPGLVVISLAKAEIQIFQFVMWPHVGLFDQRIFKGGSLSW